MAVLVLNGDAVNRTVNVSLSDIGLTGSNKYSVRDLYQRKDIATLIANETLALGPIANGDSRFVTFTPQ